MDASSFQSRAMQRLGNFPTDGDLQRAASRLISEASALRTLVGLDGARWLTDDDVTAHVGTLAVALAEVSCVLGVDLGAAFERGATDADERLRSRAERIAERRAVHREPS